MNNIDLPKLILIILGLGLALLLLTTLPYLLGIIILILIGFIIWKKFFSNNP